MNDPLPEYEQIVKECHKRGMVRTSIISDLSPKEALLTEAIYDSCLLAQTAPFPATRMAALKVKRLSENATVNET